MHDITQDRAAVMPPVLNKRLRDILSLEDFEPAAERYLPHCIFSFISGAVETNASRHENRAAFQNYDFHPRLLIDVSARSTAKTLFDETFSAPFGIAPMGGSGLAGYRADLALAAAAGAENVPFILSGASLVLGPRDVSDSGLRWTFEKVQRGRRARAVEAHLATIRSAHAGPSALFDPTFFNAHVEALVRSAHASGRPLSLAALRVQLAPGARRATAAGWRRGGSSSCPRAVSRRPMPAR